MAKLNSEKLKNFAFMKEKKFGRIVSLVIQKIRNK